MALFKIVIRPRAGYVTSWKANSLFGAVCWAMRYLDGPDALSGFLDLYREGRPPIVLSNGFPGDYLPRPYLPPSGIETRLSKAQAVSLMSSIKDTKSIAFLTLDEFNGFLSGSPPLLNRKGFRPQTEVVTYHNMIDRLSGVSASEDGLYSVTEHYCTPHVSVYAYMEADWFEQFSRCLNVAGEIGLGKRKSVGKGSFDVESIVEFRGFHQPVNANAFVALSDFVPAKGDPSRGFYRVATVHGRLAGQFASEPNPFKRPVVTVLAGSVMLLDRATRPFYGRLVTSVSLAHPDVVYYGLALPMPAFVGGELP